MRIVDLSHRIVFPHWRWKPERIVTSSHADGELFTSSRLHMPLHGFTHVDAPMHFLPGRRGDLRPAPRALVRRGRRRDLSHRGADHGITVADLEEHGQHIQAGDIVLLRTDWDKKQDIGTREFWTRGPYTTREAAEWLAARNVKAVGYDYPPDPVASDEPGELQRRPPRVPRHP